MAKKPKKTKGLTNEEILFSINQKISDELGTEKMCNVLDLPMIIEYLLFDIASSKNELRHLSKLLEDKRGY